MRKTLAVIILLLILGSAAGYILFRLTRKPLPTPRAWTAHVLTVAGDGSPAGFSDPFGVAVAGDGTVYFSDAGDNNRIQKISPEGVVITFAGESEGFADGTGPQASFNTPSAIAIDADGNLYVADTGNNRIRKITPEGVVTTVAGDGTAGFVDGPAAQARFNGPVGVALDTSGNLYVADTYNDRIRKISPDGQVTTVAGAGQPGYADGSAASALFDTPCGVVVANDGSVIVADTGNRQLRRITADGNVSTITAIANLSRPIGLAATHDGFLYVTDLDRAQVVQLAPDSSTHVVASQFNQPSSVAINPKSNELYVTDSANYLVRKLTQPNEATAQAASAPEDLPKLTSATLGQQNLLWPVDPQQSPHEVVATLGEVRGSFDSTDSRHHLHSGLDVFGPYNEIVRVVRDEKVTGPLPNWGLDSLNEGFRVGIVSYIHMHVGRDKDGKMFDDARFIPVTDAEQKLTRIRIKRGTRFKVGDALGTVNRMYHVHMNIGPPNAEINPLSLSPIGFVDDKAPTIESVALFDNTGTQIKEKQSDRLIISGHIRIVVDAYDRTNLNPERRRLGLYKLGYQLLNADGSPAQGFNEPRITILFNRLPPDDEATKVAYAEESGITVYGSAKTRFLYEVTNSVRDGRAERGSWDTSPLPKGDYILRIIAADFSGNEVQEGRDLKITIR
jgi:DNA-binding beta-propeller fold protein YncE